MLFALTCASVVCVLESLAFWSQRVDLAVVAFFAVVVTTMAVCTAFFWGFYMVMNGRIPAHRLKYLAPHAAVGVVSPVLYTLNISAGLESLGVKPVSGLSLALSFGCLFLLCLQFSMGKAVVHTGPLRVVR